MKKILSVCLTLAFASAAMAQGPADALLYSTNTYLGTARSMAMGNAFVALGGDPGAISVNPASSAIYRYSEISVTPQVINAGSTSISPNYSGRDNFTQFKFNGFSGVTSFDTYRTSGLMNVTFGLAINRIADFNKISSSQWNTSETSMLGAIASSLEGTEVWELAYSDTHNPYSQTNLPWQSILAFDTYLISPNKPSTTSYVGSTQNIDKNTGELYVGGPLDQYFFSKSRGGIMEYALNLGFNISDMVYFGVNLNMHTVTYSYDSYYSETAKDSRLFDDGIQSFTSEYFLDTGGSGFNFEIGAIVTPVAGLRIGATFTTPTVYRLTDTWRYFMQGSFDNGNNPSKSSPTGSYSYRMVTPIRWSVGLAYTFEEFGLISVDWESFNYSKIRLQNYAGNSSVFTAENQRMANGFRTSSNLRAGLEVRPSTRLSLRCGYDLYTTPGNLVDNSGLVTYKYPDTQYVSCGAGYRFGLERAFSIDFAYQRMLNNKEQYSVYKGAPQVDALNYINRFVLTFAYRF